MQEKIERTLYDLMSIFQASKIYSPGHPILQKLRNKAFISLSESISPKGEIVFGVINGELAWEDEVLFELSHKLISLVDFFELRGIQRLCFQAGLDAVEFESFLSLMREMKPGESGLIEDLLSKAGLTHIRAGRVRNSAADQPPVTPPPQETISKPYQDSLRAFEGSLDNIINRQEVDYLDLRFNILTVMENFLGSHQELLGLVSIKRKDLYTFLHLLNVSILSMFLSSRLGFSRDDTLDIGISALFHDIGKIAISRKILTKPDRLAEHEFSQMKDHAQLGALLLMDYRDSLGILPAVVSFEHHIRYDMTGYPKLPHPVRPHSASLIVSICDVYDALAQCRTYKKDYPPDKIFSIMSKEKGRLFDPALLDRFFEIMGIWPIGSIVRLDDGRVAVVRKPNETDIHNPQIEILSEPGRGETLDLSAVDRSITSALNPFNEGRAYLDGMSKK